MKSSIIASAIVIYLSILLSPLPSHSDNTGERSFRAGIIRPDAKLQNIIDGFKSGMESYGFKEGGNITYIQTDYSGDIESALRDMTAKKVDLIFTITANVTKKTKEVLENTGVPVVFGAVYDPVEAGIVKSLPEPGGNITGVKIGGSTEKAFEWLLKAVPGTKYIFIPLSSKSDTAAMCTRILEKSAAKADVELLVSHTDTPGELAKALASMPEKVDAIFIPNSIFLMSNLETILKFAAERKLPTGSGTGQYRNGIMVTYGQDHFYSGKMASRLAKSILRDKIPAGSLPVETTEFFLGINLKTAKAIGITIPDRVLQQANFIVR